jgi:subtilisin family serine protease
MNISLTLNRKRYITLLLLCLSATAASTSVTLYFFAKTKSESPASNKLSDSLQQQIEEIDVDRVITVIIKLRAIDLYDVKSDATTDVLRAHASGTQERVLEFLEGEKDTMVLNTFWLVNAILANVTVDTLHKLAYLEDVEEIFENFEVTIPEPMSESAITSSSVTWGLDRINATEAWALGFNGSGIRIAVLDTGVDISHPDLEGKMWTDNASDPTFPGGWIEFDSSGSIVTDSTPHDTHGHGTHTSGTALGGNTSGIAIGVAPGAWLMHGLILPGGSGTFAQVIAGMQWAISPFDQYGNPAGEKAHVVSMSWGASGYNDELIEPIQNMKAAGVVPVAAIGNSGEGTSGSPGNVYESFGIGAIDQYDTVASWSSGEAVDWATSYPEIYIKPDFSAPGVYIYSSLPSGKWEYWSGTSMATPHVAGTIALMFNANLNLTVDNVYDLLKITAEDLGDAGQDTRYGWGVIDAYEAVLLASMNSGVEGYVTDAETSQPIEWGAQVTAWEAWWGRKKTDSYGYYRIWLYPGSYSLTASSFGYNEQNVTVEVLEHQWTRLDFELTPLPRGFIAGVVTHVETNSTIANATITLLDTPLETIVTNATGYYSIEAPVGVYDVDGWKWGYKPSVTRGTEVFENRTTTVNIQLEPTIKVAILGDFSGQVTSLLMRNISAHERDWNVTQDIYNYDVIVVNIPTDPDNETFSALINSADNYQVGLIFTNTWPGLWSPYGISLLHKYFNDPKGSYYAYGKGDVYYEVVMNHPIFEGWNIGEKIYIISGGDEDFAWFYRYSGVTIADIGADGVGSIGGGIAYSIRENGNVHLLLAGLSQNIYTNIRNAWTDEAKTIFIRAVTWASNPVTATSPSTSITISPTSGIVGTKITVNGSGFALNSSVTVKFDDSPIATTTTNANGSFTAVFNIPIAEVGVHVIKAMDDYGTYAEAIFTVTGASDTEMDVLTIEMDVGSIHFRAETAEFYVLTSLNGVPIDVAKINATIHKPDRTAETLTVEHIAAGIYLITYNIPANASAGTYTLSVQAGVNGVNGASLRSFLVSLTLTDWSANLLAVKDGVATIQTDIGVIKMDLTSTDAKILAVQEDVVTIKTDIGEIKADVAHVKSIVENTNATVVTIDGEVATVKTVVGEIQGTITSIQEGIAIVKTSIGEIKADLPYFDGATSTLNSISTTGLSFSTILSGIVVAMALIVILTIRMERLK